MQLEDMQLEDMYQKPIDRPIDSVIKASSEEHLANELDEYIFTPDIVLHLQRFYDEYNDPDATGNGAWISGFFGSGKSHLLKILAVALEDREVDGKPALDYLLPKLDDDGAYLKGQMETARQRHPSESVLFNVDSMAENTGQDSAGAMLSAFIRAFNGHCGYFDGSQQYIAQMEYDLDSEGKLDDFKQAVFEQTDRPWNKVRAKATLYSSKISTAYDAVCGNAPGTNTNIIKHYQDDYRPSIDAFASRVSDYIAAHGRGFRLNFFVDEVGQFIAQDSERMLNLQTIAEELNTKCDGNSWVVVTSQEDVERLTGRMQAGSANDFSKIQGRFKVRMSLRSEDAEDIIKRRLLAKKDDAKPQIAKLYDEHKDDFDYLFNFTGGSRSYARYDGEDDFVNTYPFVPYQFSLFIEVMRTLSNHNALQGRYEATGARSMLGVFQDVAVDLATSSSSDVGRQEPLAAFDAMFDGLQNDIKSEFYGQVSQAERNLSGNPLAIRVLKALLLVKYCDEFPATPDNLRILLLGSLKQNTSVLESDIKSALDVLEKQRYIRRNAESGVYEYLTDEEMDVENEILNQSLGSKDQTECVGQLFRDVVGQPKTEYRHGDFRANYNFDLKVGGEAIGQKRNDLSVDLLILPVEEDGGTLLALVPSEPRTLSIQLHDDEDFLKELDIYLKTKTYVNTNGGNSNDSRRSIIENRGKENGKRYRELQKAFEELLTNASYYAAGSDVTGSVRGSGADAVHSGMAVLVGKTYSQLQQLKNTFRDNDVYGSCFDGQQLLSEADLPEYARTVLNQTRMLSSAGDVTVGGDGQSSLIRNFSHGEYGWPEVAVRNAVALLSAKGLVEVRQDGKQLEAADLAPKLKNSRNLDKLTVRVVEAIDENTLAEIRKAYRGIVGTNSNAGNDAKAMAEDLRAYLEGELESLEKVSGQAKRYPFAQRFESEVGELSQARKQLANDWNWIITGFLQDAEDLENAKDDLGKMQRFLTGRQHEIFDSVRDFCEHDLDEARELELSALQDEQALLDLMNDEDCYKSGNIPAANTKLRAIKQEMDDKKRGLRKVAEANLADYKQSYVTGGYLDGVDDEARERFEGIFEQGCAELEGVQTAHQLESFMTDFKKKHGSEIIDALKSPELEPEVEGKAVEESVSTAQSAPKPASAPVKPVQLSTFKAEGYAKPTIRTEDEVEEYLDALRGELLSEVRAGRVIIK